MTRNTSSKCGKRILIAFLTVSMMTVTASSAFADESTDSDTMNMSVEVLKPIEVIISQHLHFGRVVLGSAADTVVTIAATDGAVATTTSDGAVAMDGSTVGVIGVTGSEDASFTITYVESFTSPGTETWTLDLDYSMADNSQQSLGVSGATTGYAGGTLTIPNTTAEDGQVSLGSVVVSVDYD